MQVVGLGDVGVGLDPEGAEDGEPGGEVAVMGVGGLYVVEGTLGL